MEKTTDWKAIRARGAEKLDYWAACMRARNSKDALYAMPSTGTIEEQVNEDIKYGRTRGKRDPRRMPESQARFLEVESAFTSLAVSAAREYLGDYQKLDHDGRTNWDQFVLISRRTLRSLCIHALVEGNRPSEWKDDRLFALMACYGMNRYGFGKWLGYRLDALREHLGR